jgi:hypothetical protein
MKRVLVKRYFFVVMMIAALAAGCSGANNPTGGSAAPLGTEPTGSALSTALPANYENALPAATQLAVGIFKLEESSTPLSAEQAAAMLPLWKAYRSLTTAEQSSAQEIDALITQIRETLSEDQLKSIADLQLTGEDLMQLVQEKNLSLGAGGPGGGAGLSAEERATRQAQRFEGQGSAPGGRPEGGGFGPGGMGPGGGVMPGGELPPGAMATPSVRETAIAQRARSGDSRVSPGLVEALIAYLESKAQ